MQLFIIQFQCDFFSPNDIGDYGSHFILLKKQAHLQTTYKKITL